MICPSEHKHAATSTCRKNHGCECDRCRQADKHRHTTRQRSLRRRKAYGQYEGRVPALGTHRRIQGLQYLGWTFTHIGEIAGVSYGAVGNIFKRDTVEPETRDYIVKAFAQLIAKGQGPSHITRQRARRNGYVSPFAYNDIDHDERPTHLPRQTMLRGAELLDEVEWLVKSGVRPREIAVAVGKSLTVLERHAWRYGRNTVAQYLHERSVA